MEESTNREQDRRTYELASQTLRLGMYVSLGVMLVGLVWWLLEASGGKATATSVIPLDRLVPELAALNPLAILNLGVILLVITPGITLLTELFTFGAARNWRFVGIASLIVVILLFGVALSLKWIVLF